MNGHRQLFGSGPELRAPGSDQLTSGLPTQSGSRSVNDHNAFIGTDSTDEPITFDLPVIGELSGLAVNPCPCDDVAVGVLKP